MIFFDFSFAAWPTSTFSCGMFVESNGSKCRMGRSE
jgi:hypothetical protein